MLISTTCYAKSVEFHPVLKDYKKMTLTCYLPTGNKTASGIEPYYGIAAAKSEWIGKTAIIYERTENNEVGKFIGEFQIQDTGATDGIKNGYVIDIFCENREQCIPTQKVYVYLKEPSLSYGKENDDEEDNND